MIGVFPGNIWDGAAEETLTVQKPEVHCDQKSNLEKLLSKS